MLRPAPRTSPRRMLLPVFVLMSLAACNMPTEPAGGNEGMTNIAQRLQKRGDDAGAAEFYQRALQKNPKDVLALTSLAVLYEAHGNYAEAERYDTAALRLTPDDTDLQHAEARNLLRLGRAEEAQGWYQKILADNRHDVKALNGLGITFDYRGQHAEAETQYRKALREEPDNLTTLNNLAHSYVLAGRYEDAIAVLEPHAHDTTATPQLRENLAEAYGLADMPLDAERMLRVDRKPAEVKQALASYRMRRASLSLPATLVADLGSYPTGAVAEAEAERRRSMITDAGVTVAVKPDVQAIGGTPRFMVRATGFSTAAQLDKFCAAQIKAGAECTRLDTSRF